MAKENDNNNSGVLFRNDRKENDRQPDFKGNAEVNGVQYWVSAWKKTSQSGNSFLSISFQPKEEQGGSKPAGGNDMTDFDEDLGF